jgi:hypothetical protein
MMDYSHVMKKVRNNIIKSGLKKTSTRNLTLPNDDVIQWKNDCLFKITWTFHCHCLSFWPQIHVEKRPIALGSIHTCKTTSEIINLARKGIFAKH